MTCSPRSTEGRGRRFSSYFGNSVSRLVTHGRPFRKSLPLFELTCRDGQGLSHDQNPSTEYFLAWYFVHWLFISCHAFMSHVMHVMVDLHIHGAYFLNFH